MQQTRFRQGLQSKAKDLAAVVGTCALNVTGGPAHNCLIDCSALWLVAAGLGWCVVLPLLGHCTLEYHNIVSSPGHADACLRCGCVGLFVRLRDYLMHAV